MKTCTSIAKTPTSFTMPCPFCGQDEASICVHLASLDGEAFSCQDCELAFSPDEVRSIIGRWQKLLAWVETVPSFEEG